MSNFIDFTKNGGYRFKQFTLRKMQEAYFQILKAFVAFCNVSEEGNYIIAGMKIQGANITAGYAYIDGELCRFEQTAGTGATKIKKNIVIQSLGFKNGNNENVFRFVNAQVDAIDGVALSAFIRISPVFDADYVHTDNNFQDIDLAHLDSIEPGAEVNVQPDWLINNPLLDSYIKNKPNILVALKIGVFVGISDIPGNATYVIPFGTPIATSDFIVLGSFFTAAGDNAPQHNNLTWATRNHNVNSFELLIHETSNSAQAVQFHYMIIPQN